MYYGERLNGSTHLIGTVLAATGATVLVVLAARQGDPWKIVSFSIYGAMLLALYTLSTLYHSTRGRVKDVFRKLDHCSIYLLIAGTYTPFSLVTLRGAWGWSLLGAIWGLAILGIVQEAWLAKGGRILSVVIYVVMGWLSVIAVKPLVAALTPVGFAWLAAGGLLYTGGIVVYALDEKLRHGHGIWHVFVLAGSASQYIAILRYVAGDQRHVPAYDRARCRVDRQTGRGRKVRPRGDGLARPRRHGQPCPGVGCDQGAGQMFEACAADPLKRIGPRVRDIGPRP